MSVICLSPWSPAGTRRRHPAHGIGAIVGADFKRPYAATHACIVKNCRWFALSLRFVMRRCKSPECARVIREMFSLRDEIFFVASMREGVDGRKEKARRSGPFDVVAREGIEPPTRGFSIPCSTN
jgi:hypothetical protein